MAHFPTIEPIKCKDNKYTWLIQLKPGEGILIDPIEFDAVHAALVTRGISPRRVLHTHHHFATANRQLAATYPALQFIGPAREADKIPLLTIGLEPNQTYHDAGTTMIALDTPGHTDGGMSLFFPALQAVFTGDTLFLSGAGRMTEERGVPHVMVQTMSMYKSLPPATHIYPSNENGLANATFALSLEPSNNDLQARVAALALKQVTAPSTIGLEMQVNPFLRTSDVRLKCALGLDVGADEATVLAELYKRRG